MHEAWSLNAFIAGKYARGDESLHHVIEGRGGDCVAGNLGTDFFASEEKFNQAATAKIIPTTLYEPT